MADRDPHEVSDSPNRLEEKKKKTEKAKRQRTRGRKRGESASQKRLDNEEKRRLDDEQKRRLDDEEKSRPIVVTKRVAKVRAVAAVLDEKALEVTIENKGNREVTCSVAGYVEQKIKPKPPVEIRIPALQKEKQRLLLDTDAQKPIEKLREKHIRGLQLTVEVQVRDKPPAVSLLNVEVPKRPTEDEEESEEDGV